MILGSIPCSSNNLHKSTSPLLAAEMNSDVWLVFVAYVETTRNARRKRVYISNQDVYMQYVFGEDFRSLVILKVCLITTLFVV